MLDPTSGNFLLGLIGAAAAVVMFWYVVQVYLWPIIQNLSGNKGGLSEERVYDLMNKYMKENNKLDMELSLIHI